MKYHFCNSLSWESGQDVSTRFGSQQTGGTIIQHVRPVDLQASMAQGAAILVRWTNLLASIEQAEPQGTPESMDYAAEAAFWQNIANEFTVKTRLMWQDGWFRDYDSVAGEWSSEQDAMHLSPIFCGVAGWGQIEQLRPALAQPPSKNPYWRPFSWPPIAMTVIEAAMAAGMPSEAAEHSYRFIDASYRSIDSRTLDEYGNIPGVTRENRRLVEQKYGYDYVNSGIEGYGWGAVSIHLLIRYLLGLREVDADKIVIAPMLPQALRRSGAIYRIEPLPWGNFMLGIECTVRDAKRYAISMQCASRGVEKAAQVVENEELRQHVSMQKCEWDGTWGEERTLLLPQLLLAP